MSRTLNLADLLLARGRHLQQLGRSHDALTVFGQLAGLRELPADVAEETQVHLAEIHLGRHEYARARRHLAAALVYQPDNARYHYLMATALNADEQPDLQRAAEHYRRSLALDPHQPRCLTEFGRLALCLGQEEEGVAALRQAAELAPDDVDVLEAVAEGLCDAGASEDALRLVRTALFRHRGDAGFQRLWDGFRFRRLHEEQELSRRWATAFAAESRPMVLPFVRPDPAPQPQGSRRVRRDGPARLLPPHLRPVGIPGQKHA